MEIRVVSPVVVAGSADRTYDALPMEFRDHFSGHARQYAAHRPAYPPALFTYVASLAPGSSLVWDCGCGNGQASVALAEHFETVVATDASPAQLRHARPHPRVDYRVALAEDCPLADASADAAVVAQALHWFRLDDFYSEVRRVLRPNAPFVAWAYGLHRITPEVDAVIEHLYRSVVGPFWPTRRRFIDEQYATLPLPFAEREPPHLVMTRSWTLAELLAYVGTWSAVQRYRRDREADPLEVVRNDLTTAWGAADEPREITWPLFLRVGVPHECRR